MKVFDNIIRLYYEINSIYYEMLKLELDNKIEDKEFLKLVSLLKTKINEEMELFEEFINDYKEDYDLVLTLLESQALDLEDYIESRLKDYMSVHSQDNSLKDSELTEEKLVRRDTMKKLDRLYVACSKNLYLIYLSFLQEYIESSAFSSINESILSFKYFTSIINHDVESVLVDNNFNVSKINYVDFDFMSTSLGINLGLSEEIRYMVYEDAIRSSVIDLLSFNDSDYNDEYKKANCIYDECMLKAGLLLLSEDKAGYDMVINNVNKLINELEDFNNGLSVSIVRNIIDSKDKDKSRVRKISINPLQQ